MAGIKLHSDQTFPVGAAVHVDEEDPQGDHQLHDGAQGSPVLGLSDLRGVSRSRQNESSTSETCEEPGREGGVRSEVLKVLPSDEKHGHVLGKTEEEPATNKGNGESYEGPFLANNWKCNG